MLLYEFKADLDAYLAGLSAGASGATGAGAGQRLAGAPVRSLADLIAFNERHRTAEMPFFGQELLERSQAKGTADRPRLPQGAGPLPPAGAPPRHRRDPRPASARRHRRPDRRPALADRPGQRRRVLGGSSTPAAVAGYPSITVPAGQVFGLPVGISFIGGAWSEPTLIRLAYAFEQATRHRLPPRFQPTADLPAAAVAGAPGPPAGAG